MARKLTKYDAAFFTIVGGGTLTGDYLFGHWWGGLAVGVPLSLALAYPAAALELRAEKKKMQDEG